MPLVRLWRLRRRRVIAAVLLLAALAAAAAAEAETYYVRDRLAESVYGSAPHRVPCEEWPTPGEVHQAIDRNADPDHSDRVRQPRTRLGGGQHRGEMPGQSGHPRPLRVAWRPGRHQGDSRARKVPLRRPLPTAEHVEPGDCAEPEARSPRTSARWEPTSEIELRAPDVRDRMGRLKGSSSRGGRRTFEWKNLLRPRHIAERPRTPPHSHIGVKIA